MKAGSILSWSLLASGLAAGCAGPASRPAAPSTQLSPTRPAPPRPIVLEPHEIGPLESVCFVPAGWAEQPLETKGPALHQVWISPGGSTAYGVMTVRNLLLPFASDSIVLTEFLRNMKASDGKAELESKQADPELAGGLGGIRFVALGARYHMRANLVTSGTRVWVIYAGTLVNQAVQFDELRTAESARERTVLRVRR